MLAIVDDCTRENLALVADTSLSGVRVARELDRLIAARGRPKMIVSDNWNAWQEPEAPEIMARGCRSGRAAGLSARGSHATWREFLAAMATGKLDRWQAGAGLMQIADSVGARSIARATRIVGANAEVLRGCAEAARKAGREQKCTVMVGVE